MSRKHRLVCAGVVVLRHDEEQSRQVLVVHRPQYDDWSLPKGRPEPDEDMPVVAVREVQEETGLLVRLTRPLGRTDYQTSAGKKYAWWWQGVPEGGDLLEAGTPVREQDGHSTQEVDQARWVDVEEARTLLSYPTERDVLDRALAGEPGAVIVLVRHAKAMLRKNWSGKDFKRPLNGRGRRQAKRLAPLLAAYGVTNLVSSTSTRCVQTLAPRAQSAGLEVLGVSELSEESYESSPKKSTKAMARLVAAARADTAHPTAICGHRPVLPMMREQLGLEPDSMLVAEAVIIHHHPDGTIAGVEVIKSAF